MSGLQSNIGGIGKDSIKSMHLAADSVINTKVATNTIYSRELGASAVMVQELHTYTASAAGTLAAGLAVGFAVNAYSFQPDVSIETTLAQLEPAAAGPSQVDSPRIRVRNNDSVTRAYQAAWRYMGVS